MNQSEFKVHSDQETTASELKEKATIAERGKLVRVVRLISPSLLRKSLESIVRRGKLVQLALILLGVGFLLFEAFVDSPWPLILVVVVLSFIAGWKKAGSSIS